MGKLIVNLNLTLDGVTQAPDRPDEDTRNGFTHGGWGAGYFDPVMAQEAGKGMAARRVMLFGRRTYEDFYKVWPNRTDGNMFIDVLNNAQKYVASRTLKAPLPWMNSTLLEGDTAEAVGRLKRDPQQDVLVLGSVDLVQWLMRQGLIDQYSLNIYPLVLGTGSRLFDGAPPFTKLRLTDSKTSTTGVVLATFVPEEGES